MDVRPAVRPGLAALPIDFPGIRSRSFADVRLVIAMPERHRLAAKSVVTVDDIKDEPFIALRPHNCCASTSTT